MTLLILGTEKKNTLDLFGIEWKNSKLLFIANILDEIIAAISCVICPVAISIHNLQLLTAFDTIFAIVANAVDLQIVYFEDICYNT